MSTSNKNARVDQLLQELTSRDVPVDKKRKEEIGSELLAIFNDHPLLTLNYYWDADPDAEHPYVRPYIFFLKYYRRGAYDFRKQIYRVCPNKRTLVEAEYFKGIKEWQLLSSFALCCKHSLWDKVDIMRDPSRPGEAEIMKFWSHQSLLGVFANKKELPHYTLKRLLRAFPPTTVLCNRLLFKALISPHEYDLATLQLLAKPVTVSKHYTEVPEELSNSDMNKFVVPVTQGDEALLVPSIFYKVESLDESKKEIFFRRFGDLLKAEKSASNIYLVNTIRTASIDIMSEFRDTLISGLATKQNPKANLFFPGCCIVLNALGQPVKDEPTSVHEGRLWKQHVTYKVDEVGNDCQNMRAFVASLRGNDFYTVSLDLQLPSIQDMAASQKDEMLALLQSALTQNTMLEKVCLKAPFGSMEFAQQWLGTVVASDLLHRRCLLDFRCVLMDNANTVIDTVGMEIRRQSSNKNTTTNTATVYFAMKELDLTDSSICNQAQELIGQFCENGSLQQLALGCAAFEGSSGTESFTSNVVDFLQNNPSLTSLVVHCSQLNILRVCGFLQNNNRIKSLAIYSARYMSYADNQDDYDVVLHLLENHNLTLVDVDVYFDEHENEEKERVEYYLALNQMGRAKAREATGTKLQLVNLLNDCWRGDEAEKHYWLKFYEGLSPEVFKERRHSIMFGLLLEALPRNWASW